MQNSKSARTEKAAFARYLSNKPKQSNVFIYPGKLDNHSLLTLVCGAFDSYANPTKTHSAADILLSEVDAMAGDQLNHLSTLSSL